MISSLEANIANINTSYILLIVALPCSCGMISSWYHQFALHRAHAYDVQMSCARICAGSPGIVLAHCACNVRVCTGFTSIVLTMELRRRDPDLLTPAMLAVIYISLGKPCSSIQFNSIQFYIRVPSLARLIGSKLAPWQLELDLTPVTWHRWQLMAVVGKLGTYVSGRPAWIFTISMTEYLN